MTNGKKTLEAQAKAIEAALKEIGAAKENDNLNSDVRMDIMFAESKLRGAICDLNDAIKKLNTK